jgi:Ca2+-binding RTX toxin-like protein
VRVNLATGLGFGGDAEGDDIAGFERLLGGALGDTLTGSAANETIHGLAGNDSIRGGAGADLLRGGDGNDTIEGGTGRDQMFGGAGADRFFFRAVAESAPDQALCDVIRDFQTGLDRINVSSIDAKPGTTGVNDAFGWSASFTAAGQARLTTVDGNTLFEANLDADADAEFAVLIIGTGVVQADFVL